MRAPRPGPGFADAVAALSDDDIEQIIDGYDSTVLGLSFWVGEMERRRSSSLLDRIADASIETAVRIQELAHLTAVQAEENQQSAALLERIAQASNATARQMELLADLTADQARENARTAKLNQAMAWMTFVNVLIAAGALIVAAVALTQG